MLSGALAGVLKVGAVALVSVGLGAGVYFAVQAAQDESAPVQPQPTATRTPAALSPPASLSPPPDIASPTPTAAPPTATEAPPPPPPADTPAPGPTPDTRVPIRDLPTADQIQLGPDGKYFIADRGDGCRWVEYSRTSSPALGEDVILTTDCQVDFSIGFRPETREVFPVMS